MKTNILYIVALVATRIYREDTHSSTNTYIVVPDTYIAAQQHICSGAQKHTSQHAVYTYVDTFI
jgi:hypothetical protein